MLIRKAKKYRVKVRPQQEEIFARFAGCQRFLWNHFLALQKSRLDQDLRCLSYADMCKELTVLKGVEETTFLAEVHSQTLQQTLKDIDRALKDAFAKKKKFPRFKKKGRNDSFRYPQGVKLKDGRIFFPKIGWFCFFCSGSNDGIVKNATVSRRGKSWFVSIQVEKEVPEPVHPSQSKVGIDMGCVRFATLSSGKYFEPANHFSRLEHKLAIAQRRLSRKVKFSNNWRKQKKQVQEVHRKIADARADYLHKVSTTISKSHAMIVMEELKVATMSRSKSGKTRLNKKILDQGWYEFRRQLEYKQLWRGGTVVLVDPCNTSRTCPLCKHISKDNRKSQAHFKCVSCGFSGNADFVAACNILMAVGHTVSACGDTKLVAV